MNPFTRFLNQWSKNNSLSEFIGYWDRLEKLVVLVYQEKMSPAAAETEFNHVWPWLRKNYDVWSARLRPYWQKTKAAGEFTQMDPFQLVLDIEAPAAILGDWRAMQHLPAAREALNLFVQDQGSESYPSYV